MRPFFVRDANVSNNCKQSHNETDVCVSYAASRESSHTQFASRERRRKSIGNFRRTQRSVSAVGNGTITNGGIYNTCTGCVTACVTSTEITLCDTDLPTKNVNTEKRATALLN